MRREYLIVGSDQVPESGTIYFNEDGPPRTRPVDWSKYNTFISHKSTDIRPTQEAAMVLANSGLVGYLDRWDPNVSGDHPDLEDYLRKIIRETPSILTIVSEETNTSWWVPFEVGVARETDSEIATYLLVNPNGPPLVLPSFLRKWPILASPAELQTWSVGLARSFHGVGMRRILLEGIAKMSAQDYQGTEVSRLERSGRVRFV